MMLDINTDEKKKGGYTMADLIPKKEEFMSDTALSRLIEYLKEVEHFTDAQIVKLLEYISKR